eukprot:TRINITY_DN3891_c0_g1_i1.p1 TRINITY_DN3891_c0_g1~~TRINITY_DN3891_c0_g1_i1.p1  ORF type:complete len:554 (+),score=148.17 TRINITY_DN3891_c0_g1_i1:202-1662(+)
MLQLQDNGKGIHAADFPLLCERFATSKLAKFEDLQGIATYGFRGEALASISHIAHMKVVSMTEGAQCAYRASFLDGKMCGHAAPAPGVKGTLITVEDLFYNVATRRKTLKNANDEYQKIVEVVSRYALHNSGIGITCKKYGENQSEVHTVRGTTLEDNIRLMFGHNVARELLPFKCTDEKLGFVAEGHISNANYSMKKTTFILFINHRLVDSTHIKKAMESVYQQYLPKSSHPWIYLSLSVAPQNIDVNVHPTKSEVRFLHEDDIVDALHKSLEDTLAAHNSSRTFVTQTLSAVSTSSQKCPPTSSATATASVPQYKLDRSDAHSQTLQAFLQPVGELATATATTTTTTPIATAATGAVADAVSVTDHYTEQQTQRKADSQPISMPPLAAAPTATVPPPTARKRVHGNCPSAAPAAAVAHTRRPKKFVLSPLSSIQSFISRIEELSDAELVDVLDHATWVGCVNVIFSLVQCRTRLLVFNMQTMRW